MADAPRWQAQALPVHEVGGVPGLRTVAPAAPATSAVRSVELSSTTVIEEMVARWWAREDRSVGRVDSSLRAGTTTATPMADAPDGASLG